MARDGFRVSASQVAACASAMENLNNTLADTLQQSNSLIAALSNVWSGDAAQSTISAYNAFAKKYSDEYKKTIGDYVAFLRTDVEQGYIQTEQKNVSLSDRLK